MRLACLSNDVSEWSLNLRNRFGLDRLITDWVISGDVGYRKPDPEIYQELLRRLQVMPSEVLFIDDRVKNLTAAATLGFHVIGFGPDMLGQQGFPTVLDMPELGVIIQSQLARTSGAV